MIQIKSLDVFLNMWVPMHFKLKEVLEWYARRYGTHNMVITSAYREGDKGVHGTNPLRGIDLRSRMFRDPWIVANIINHNWKYDPKRPAMSVCLYHSVGLGPHFHIQVHDNTTKVLTQ